MMTVLEGVVMELQDCAFPLLQGDLMVKNCSNKIGLVQMKQFHLIVPCMSCSIWEKKHFVFHIVGWYCYKYLSWSYIGVGGSPEICNATVMVMPPCLI